MKKKSARKHSLFDLFVQNELEKIASKKIKGGIVVVDVISV